MGSSAPLVPLLDIAARVPNATAAGPFGSNLVSNDYVDAGVPVIRGQNLTTRWVGGDFVFVSSEKAESLRTNTARPGDIVFTQRGTLGQVSMVPSDGTPRYVISQSQMKLTVDPEKADAAFVYYCCSSPAFVKQVQDNAVAAGVPHINLGILRRLEIPLPTLGEQRSISSLLGYLDDRIDTLRATNATLEAIAQALFKSWFVDFDPVHAKAEGRARQDGARSGQRRKPQASDLPRPGAEAGAEAEGAPAGMDAATAALFPSEFEDSELGPIPKGWRVDEIGHAVRCVGGATPSTKNDGFWSGGTHHWATPKDLSGLAAPVLTTTERLITDEGVERISSGLLPTGTLLMSSRAPIGYLAIAAIPTAINQGFIAMLPGGDLPPSYLLCWAKQNIESIKQAANGSTFMEISKAAFRPMLVCVPSKDVINAFQGAVDPLIDCITANLKQSATLAGVRDTLLPRLISGKLRLPEARSIAEAEA